jgi:phospholipid/cholesterol/gamma-HCH transport system substrate-binding protein
MRHLNTSTQKLDQNMEAAQHNFLLRGFFKKKEREKKKKEEEAAKKKQEEQEQKQNGKSKD